MKNTASGTKKILPSQHDANSKQPLKLVRLTLVRLGPNENEAFGTKNILPSQHDASTPEMLLKVMHLASARLGTNQNTAFVTKKTYLILASIWKHASENTIDFQECIETFSITLLFKNTTMKQKSTYAYVFVFS